MGDIITQAYLEGQFDKRRIATLVDDGGGAKASIIAEAINAAEAEVRNLLSRQYTLAQLQADVGVKRCVAVATMYILELRRSDVSKGISFAYQQSLNYLQRLIEGEAKLSAVDEVLPRVTHKNAADAFQRSGYFTGYLGPELPDDGSDNW